MRSLHLIRNRINQRNNYCRFSALYQKLPTKVLINWSTLWSSFYYCIVFKSVNIKSNWFLHINPSLFILIFQYISHPFSLQLIRNTFNRINPRKIDSIRKKRLYSNSISNVHKSIRLQPSSLQPIIRSAAVIYLVATAGTLSPWSC